MVNNGDSVTYPPDEVYFGSDSFTYTTNDGRGLFDTAVVFVTVIEVPPENNPPVAVGDSTSTN